MVLYVKTMHSSIEINFSCGAGRNKWFLECHYYICSVPKRVECWFISHGTLVFADKSFEIFRILLRCIWMVIFGGEILNPQCKFTQLVLIEGFNYGFQILAPYIFTYLFSDWGWFQSFSQIPPSNQIIQSDATLKLVKYTPSNLTPTSPYWKHNGFFTIQSWTFKTLKEVICRKKLNWFPDSYIRMYILH